MGKEQRLRIHELGLPPEVLEAARSSDEFSPQAQAAILDFIQGCEVHLSDIQSRIAVLQLPMQSHMRQVLQNEEEIAQDRLRSCRGLLSTMRQIPTEVMGEIFQFYLAPGGSIIGQQTPVEPKPTLLCLVSRRWYAIAMSTSSLWSNITAWVVGERDWDPPRIRPADVPGLLKCIDRFRFQPWSLTIKPRSDPFHYDPTRPLLASFFHKHPASQHLQHLQRLAINAEKFVIGLDDLTFPRVISVTVSSLENGSYLRQFGLPSLPNLTHAVFASVIEAQDVPSNIPWSQLTHLCLGGNISSSHWRKIFKLCTSLERGVFSNTSHGNPESAPLDWTAHPHLTQLDFVSSEPPYMSDDDITGMSLPSLTKLRLFANFMQSSWTFPQALFGRVTHLTIVPNAMPARDPVLGTLREFPNLRELFVGLGDGEFEEVFGYLRVGEDGACHLPFLEALGVRIAWHCCGDSPIFPYERLKELVASRTKDLQGSGTPDSPAIRNTIAVPLRHLVLQVERWFEADVVEDVVVKLREATKEFANHGLRISVIQVGGTFSRQWGWDWSKLVDTNKHWDEGLMDFLDDATEFGLYPVNETLRSG